MWPVVTLLPAALVGSGSQKTTTAAIAAVLLAWIPVQVQGQFFLYHGVAFPVVAAVIVTGALCRNMWLALPLIVLSTWSGWLLSSSIVSSHQLVSWWLLSAAMSSLVLLC
jgi:hypothetical protein